MRIDVDADLNKEDDDGFNVASVPARRSLTVGDVVTAGRPGFWSWAEVVRVEPRDGDRCEVVFRQVSRPEALARLALPPGPWEWRAVSPAEVARQVSPGAGADGRWGGAPEEVRRGLGLVAADGTVLLWSESGYGSPDLWSGDVRGGFGQLAHAIEMLPDLLSLAAVPGGTGHGFDGHDPRREPVSCLLASLTELANAQLPDGEVSAAYEHGRAALGEVQRLLRAAGLSDD